jgi:hypothetical protein
MGRPQIVETSVTRVRCLLIGGDESSFTADWHYLF